MIVLPPMTAHMAVGGGKVHIDAMLAELFAEIDSGALTVVRERPICVHILFCVLKELGGFRGTGDCSHPDRESLTIGDIVAKFSYNSVDDVAVLMQRGDSLTTSDIQCSQYPAEGP